MLLLLSGRLMASLADTWELFKTGTLWRSYAKANPNESARVDTYWRLGGADPAARTITGRALTGIAAHDRGDIHG